MLLFFCVCVYVGGSVFVLFFFFQLQREKLTVVTGGIQAFGI